MQQILRQFKRLDDAAVELHNAYVEALLDNGIDPDAVCNECGGEMLRRVHSDIANDETYEWMVCGCGHIEY